MHGVHKQTDKQGQTDRQCEVRRGGRWGRRRRRSVREKERGRKKRERQCALSCPNENKQLSDPLQM